MLEGSTKDLAAALEEIEDLSKSTVEMPFQLDDSEESAKWLLELEFTDVLEGSVDALRALADRAPTDTARAYLRGIIEIRSSLAIFGRPQ